MEIYKVRKRWKYLSGTFICTKWTDTDTIGNSIMTESSDQIISAASCTTNCLAPVAKVMNDNFGIQTRAISLLL